MYLRGHYRFYIQNALHCTDNSIGGNYEFKKEIKKNR
jgi:hypothetical protein